MINSKLLLFVITSMVFSIYFVNDIFADSELPPVYQIPAAVFDNNIYTWGDTVPITVISPFDNTDPNVIDLMQTGERDGIGLHIRTNGTPITTLDNYSLIETGPDTGIFVGSIVLVEPGTFPTGGNGPDDGYLEIDESHTSFYVSFTTDRMSISGMSQQFTSVSNSTSATQHSIDSMFPHVQFRWLESITPSEGIGLVRMEHPSKNISSDALDNFVVTFGTFRQGFPPGVHVLLTETGENTGIFEGRLNVATYDSPPHDSPTKLRLPLGNPEDIQAWSITNDYNTNMIYHPFYLQNNLEPQGEISTNNLDNSELTFVTDKDAYLSNQQLSISGTSDPNEDLIVKISSRHNNIGKLQQIITDSKGVFTTNIEWLNPENIPAATYAVQVFNLNDGISTTKNVVITSMEDLRDRDVHLTPKQQIRMGLASNEIVCPQVWKLMFHPNGESPSCVKLPTYHKLLERGWEPVSKN